MKTSVTGLSPHVLNNRKHKSRREEEKYDRVSKLADIYHIKSSSLHENRSQSPEHALKHFIERKTHSSAAFPTQRFSGPPFCVAHTDILVRKASPSLRHNSQKLKLNTTCRSPGDQVSLREGRGSTMWSCGAVRGIPAWQGPARGCTPEAGRGPHSRRGPHTGPSTNRGLRPSQEKAELPLVPTKSSKDHTCGQLGARPSCQVPEGPGKRSIMADSHQLSSQTQLPCSPAFG